MRFQLSSSIPWDLIYSEYVKSKLYSTCRHSHSLNCQVTPWKQSVYRYVCQSQWGTHYWGHLSTLYVNQFIPWDILTRFNSHFGPGRMDFLSCCCESQCFSVGYSPLVESLRWDKPVHKEGWTLPWTHDNPTGWTISDHLCVAASFNNCQRTAGRSLE
jgi:hypothetical protein